MTIQSSRLSWWTLALVLAASSLRDVAQAPAADQSGPADPAADVGGPRLYKAQGYEVVLHQPQVDRWENYERLHFRAAVVLRKQGAADSAFGFLQCSAPTSVDLEARTVFVGPRKVDALSFGDVNPAEVERLRGVVLAALPDEQPFTIPLDRVSPPFSWGKAAEDD